MLGVRERTRYVRSFYGDSFRALEACDPRTPYTMRKKGERKIISVGIGLCMSESGKLCYDDLERGHMLDGKVVKHLKDGVVFRSEYFGAQMVFKPLTLDEFNRYFRQYWPKEVSDILNTLDDVYVWYRKQARLV